MDALENARAALLKELAGSALGTRLGAFQGALRSVLVELVAALRAPGVDAASVRPVLERAERALKDAGTPNFWEITV